LVWFDKMFAAEVRKIVVEETRAGAKVIKFGGDPSSPARSGPAISGWHSITAVPSGKQIGVAGWRRRYVRFNSGSWRINGPIKLSEEKSWKISTRNGTSKQDISGGPFACDAHSQRFSHSMIWARGKSRGLKLGGAHFERARVEVSSRCTCRARLRGQIAARAQQATAAPKTIRHRMPGKYPTSRTNPGGQDFLDGLRRGRV